MNEPRVIHCPQCSRVFKSLRGLAQHINFRKACAALARPLLEGATNLYDDPDNSWSSVYEDVIDGSDTYGDDGFTPLWQEVDEDGPNFSLINEWKCQQTQHGLHATVMADTEAAVDATIFSHLNGQPLNDPNAMADAGDGEDDTFLHDDLFCGFHDTPFGHASIDDWGMDELGKDEGQPGSSPFYDRLDGKYTVEEMLSLRLLKLLRALKAPNYAYGKIMALFSDASLAEVSFSSCFKSRSAAIKHFGRRFGLQSLAPMTLTKHFRDRSYPVVVHNSGAMIKSLLFSSLMVEKNMIFPNADNPLAPPPLVSPVIGDIVTGDA